jgi:hypothetical protein
MADAIFVVVLVAFFALSVLYVTWCNRIIGPDEISSDVPADEVAEPLEVAA